MLSVHAKGPLCRIYTGSHQPKWEERRGRGHGDANPVAHCKLGAKNECFSLSSAHVFHNILLNLFGAKTPIKTSLKSHKPLSCFVHLSTFILGLSFILATLLTATSRQQVSVPPAVSNL